MYQELYDGILAIIPDQIRKPIDDELSSFTEGDYMEFIDNTGLAYDTPMSGIRLRILIDAIDSYIVQPQKMIDETLSMIDDLGAAEFTMVDEDGNNSITYTKDDEKSAQVALLDQALNAIRLEYGELWTGDNVNFWG